MIDKPIISNSDAIKDTRLIRPNDEGMIISLCCISDPFKMEIIKA